MSIQQAQQSTCTVNPSAVCLFVLPNPNPSYGIAWVVWNILTDWDFQRSLSLLYHNGPIKEMWKQCLFLNWRTNNYQSLFIFFLQWWFLLTSYGDRLLYNFFVMFEDKVKVTNEEMVKLIFRSGLIFFNFTQFNN